MKIPFSPPYIDDQVVAEVTDSLRSGWITTGPKVKALQEFPGIDLRVEPVIELRMAQEDQVVDGHHALDVRLADAEGQFAA